MKSFFPIFHATCSPWDADATSAKFVIDEYQASRETLHFHNFVDDFLSSFVNNYMMTLLVKVHRDRLTLNG